MKNLVSIGLMALLLSSSGNAAAAGRYTMMPADDGGFIRLDTETGAMALCKKADAGWSCAPINEQSSTLSADNKRLRAENTKLKAELKQFESFVFPKDGKPPHAPGHPPGHPRGELKLPSEQDVDKALTYLQRMFRKFKDKLDEIEKETRKTPPGHPRPPGSTTPL